VAKVGLSYPEVLFKLVATIVVNNVVRVAAAVVYAVYVAATLNVIRGTRGTDSVLKKQSH